MYETINKTHGCLDDIFLLLEKKGRDQNLEFLKLDTAVGSMSNMGEMSYFYWPHVFYAHGFIFCLGDHKLQGRIVEFDTFSQKSRELTHLFKPVSRTAAVASPNEIVVAGGNNRDHSQINNCCVYAHQTGKWTDLPSLQEKRWGHQMCWLNDGQILAIGGYNDTDYNLPSAELLQRPWNLPTSCRSLNKSWRSVAKMNMARSWFGCSIVDLNIVVAGGHGAAMSVEVFRPPNIKAKEDIGQWTKLSDLAGPMGSHISCYLVPSAAGLIVIEKYGRSQLGKLKTQETTTNLDRWIWKSWIQFDFICWGSLVQMVF